MTEGPIEFLSDEAVKRVGDSEYGGSDGLIQPELDPLGGEGHALESYEAHGIALRHGMRPLSAAVARSGEEELAVGAGDVSGRVVPEDMLEDVTGNGGQFSDLKP